MAGQIELPFWPSSIDCLSWSKDNLLAVAGGDSVAILSPRLKTAATNGLYWDSTIFKANAFTVEEIPLREPISLKNLSVGEEISLRHVHSLAWSSPGLGRHGRCVLAILSSNHVLSIWEYVGRPDSSIAWRRVSVVNNTLASHYASVKKYDRETYVEFAERQQVSQRIRAFAWSHFVHKEWIPSDKSSRFTDHGHQFLAVSTEAGDILLLRVITPNHVLEPEADTWRVEVTDCINAILLIPQSDASDDETEGYDAEHEIADHLAWGPIDPTDDFEMRSKLAFISRGRLHYATTECSPYNKDSTATFIDTERKHMLSSRNDLTGPLVFIPGTQSLMVFGPDLLMHVNISSDVDENNSWITHDLDGRWDEVSGIAFAAGKANQPQLHIASTLSSPTARTTTVPLPSNQDQNLETPRWQTALRGLAKSFSDKYKLNGKVASRVYGIAASPLGDLVATATVLLPSDAPAYITPSEYRTTVTVSSCRAAQGDAPGLDGFSRSYDITSSVLLFSMQQYEAAQSKKTDRTTLIEAMSHIVQVPNAQINYDLDNSMCSGMGPVQHVRYLRLRLFLLPKLRNARFELLAGMATKKKYECAPIEKLLLPRLVSEVLKIPASFSQAGVLSDKIRQAYLSLRSKLQVGSEDTSAAPLQEECRICKSYIELESIRWARCAEGHQFSRCGLTFLAIQEPGISKHCTLCDTQFFDEWALPCLGKLNEAVKDGNIEMTDVPEPKESAATTDEAQPEPASTADRGWVHVSSPAAKIEPNNTLARILFAAFDNCIYCGGNF